MTRTPEDTVLQTSAHGPGEVRAAQRSPAQKCPSSREAKWELPTGCSHSLSLSSS